VLIREQSLSPYVLTICNNPEYQKLEQQILRQARNLKEAENTAKNLSIVLTGLNVEAGKITERALILTRQLEKISLSLILPKEKKATGALNN
jgi:hypothetical protein